MRSLTTSGRTSECKSLTLEESRGQHIYQSNPFIRDIATFMESPENREFYEKYMTNQSELEQTLLFLSVYHSICKKAPKLNGLQRISLLTKFFKDPQTRELLARHMTNWLDGNMIES
jgi:hypothetical protein